MNDLREKIAKILERHDFAGDDWWDNIGDLFSLFTEELEKERKRYGKIEKMAKDMAGKLMLQSYGEEEIMDNIATFNKVNHLFSKKREKGYKEGSVQNMSSDEAWSVGQQAYREGIRDGKNR